MPHDYVPPAVREAREKSARVALAERDTAALESLAKSVELASSAFAHMANAIQKLAEGALAALAEDEAARKGKRSV